MPSWLITIFSSEFSIDLCHRVIDLMFLSGSRAFIIVILSIFTELKDKLLSMNYEQTMKLLTKMSLHHQFDVGKIIKRAYKFDVTHSVL